MTKLQATRNRLQATMMAGLTACLTLPALVGQAYLDRGCTLAFGGEWLVPPLTALIVYAVYPWRWAVVGMAFMAFKSCYSLLERVIDKAYYYLGGTEDE